MATSTPIGFAGLSSFVTDVDRALTEADRIAAGPMAPAPSPASPSQQPTPVHHDGGAIPAGLKKIGGWVVGIGLIIAVKACIFGGVHAVSSSGSSYPTTATEEAPAIQTEAVAPASDESGTAAEPYGDDAISTEDTSATEDDGSEARPEAGAATLSRSELRYCMAEDIRMSGQKAELNSLEYSDVERFNQNVDQFNDAANDYNNRCSGRSVMNRDQDALSSEIESRRSELEAEGRGRVS